MFFEDIAFGVESLVISNLGRNWKDLGKNW